jgi:hypothetical protein
MTFTHMTFPTVTANAILAEERSGEMPVANSNSAKQADDQRWNAVVVRDSGLDGEFVFAVASTGDY